ncbi:MAG: metallophosphoesterase [Archaeoglobaceae archaeon]
MSTENLVAITREVDNHVRIVCVGDLHIGSRCSNYKELEKQLDRELSIDNTHLIWVGDLADYAVIGSKGNVYDAVLTPEQQKQEVKRLLTKYRDKTLLVVEGNHEYRIRRSIGMSDIADWCSENGIAYTRDIGVVALYVKSKFYGTYGRALFLIAVAHGYTNARTLGGKLTGSGRIMDVVENADIYITGHTHQASVTPHARFIYDPKTKKLVLRKYFLITVPSHTGYEEYAAKKFLHPSANAFVHIFLSVVKKEKHVSAVIR